MFSDFSLSQNKRLAISIYILLTVHICGAIGMSLGFKDWFLQFTPYNLILSTGLLFYNHEQVTAKVVIFFLGIFFLGFAIEVWGVASGIPFGSYYYGESLGFKLLGVPLTIGMNWAALCFASAIIVNSFLRFTPLKIIVGGALPVLVDVFIERVCEKLDFWYWTETNLAPIQNYTTWYLCSLLFVAVFIFVLKSQRNPFAKYFILVQFLFFVILTYTLV
jgi:bisanhydrobacterioruberin hydratase